MLPYLSSAPDLLLAAATLLLAYFVRGITGFGSALVAVPLLAFLLPIKVILPLIGLLDFLGSLAHGIHHREAVSRPDMKALIPALSLGVLAALWLLHEVESEQLTPYLAGFVLLYAVWSLTPHKLPPGERIWAGPLGFLGGFVDTALGTGGPFYVIYFHLRELSKRAFRATAGVTFALDGSVRLVGYLVIGLFTPEVGWLILAGLPMVALGMWLGGRVHLNLPESAFRTLIAVLLLASGVALLQR